MSEPKLNIQLPEFGMNYYINNICPYGDGQSSIKIFNILKYYNIALIRYLKEIMLIFNIYQIKDTF